MNATEDYLTAEKSLGTGIGITGRSQRVVPGSKFMSICVDGDGEGEVCRICLDLELPTSQFIHPCRCSGTMKYVHEECLKTWLLSRSPDLATSQCELCTTKYLMKISIKRKCVPKEACGAGAAHCFFIPILLTVKVMLLVIVYLLVYRFLSSSSTSEQKGYIVALSITCLIAEIIIIALLVNTIKEACYAARMEEWKILSQDFEERQIITQDKIEKFSEIRTSAIKLPKKLKIDGINVRVPRLKPLMTPVMRSGKVISFSPKYLTPSHHRDKTSIHELNDSDIKD